jgi:hypothetical protein
MAIHFVPVGIEANSKEEAEQKVIKLQQIATAYKPPEKIQSKKMGSISSGILKAMVGIGVAWLQHRTEQQSPPQETIGKVPEYRRKSKRKEKKADKIVSMDL